MINMPQGMQGSQQEKVIEEEKQQIMESDNDEPVPDDIEEFGGDFRQSNPGILKA
jgi:hypothetical protein